MSNVQRYNSENDGYMAYDVDGSYVSFADYDALVAELAMACQGAKAAIAAGGKVASQLATAEARIRELEAALRKYGMHNDGCDLMNPCSCGFRAALVPKEPT